MFLRGGPQPLWNLKENHKEMVGKCFGGLDPLCSKICTEKVVIGGHHPHSLGACLSVSRDRMWVLSQTRVKCQFHTVALPGCHGRGLAFASSILPCGLGGERQGPGQLQPLPSLGSPLLTPLPAGLWRSGSCVPGEGCALGAPVGLPEFLCQPGHLCVC